MAFTWTFRFPQVCQTTDLGSSDIHLTNVNKFRVSLFTGSNTTSQDLGSVVTLVTSDGTNWTEIDFGKNKRGSEYELTSNLGSTPKWRVISFLAGSLTLEKVTCEYKGENYTS